LSLSIVSAAKNRKPIKLTWTFPDEDPMMRCESPVVEDRFPCDGWCRNIEGPSTVAEQMYRVDADVVLLASTKDSQDVWAAENVSMTSVSIQFFFIGFVDG
jgi:UDP-N-acetyl-D-mannosaminuronic acid transferase (WecB/TagA/CpsF family)